MKALIEYSIPIKGLNPGVHQYSFQIGSEFFENFANSLVEDGDLHVNLSLEKRPDLYVLDFLIEGTVQTECDRCLVTIDLPVSCNEQLLVKMRVPDAKEEAEVVYIHPDTQQLSVAQYIYEFISLAVPMVKIYNCQEESPQPCDQEMLKFLNSEDSSNESAGNPTWDALKDFKE